MTRKDLKGKRITVVGLGIHGGGAGTVRFLAESGALVLVTDIKRKEELAPSLEKLRGLKVKYVLGQHRPEDFEDADLIIRNPAVPQTFKYFDIARARNIPITSDIALFFALCPAPICAITGTKGKSTTASLIANMVAKTKHTVLAGNIGVPALSTLRGIKPESIVVLELSSWQLEDLAQETNARPAIAVITNITEDHLDRHLTKESYIAAKKIIFARQKKDDVLVLNYDDPESQKLGAEAKSNVYYFSASKDLPQIIAEESRYRVGAFIRDDTIFYGRLATKITALSDIKLTGTHNIANALAAVTAASLLKAPAKNIAKAIINARELPGRLQLVGTSAGNVRYINDTTATNPSALTAALEAMAQDQEGRHVVLIAGGVDKDLNYESTLPAIGKTVKYLVLLEGSASKKIEALLKKHQTVPHVTVHSMDEAVDEAALHTSSGDTVLLSPGASSFNLFQNEFDRGEQFTQAVMKIINGAR